MAKCCCNQWRQHVNSLDPAGCLARVQSLQLPPSYAVTYHTGITDKAPWRLVTTLSPWSPPMYIPIYIYIYTYIYTQTKSLYFYPRDELCLVFLPSPFPRQTGTCDPQHKTYICSTQSHTCNAPPTVCPPIKNVDLLEKKNCWQGLEASFFISCSSTLRISGWIWPFGIRYLLGTPRVVGFQLPGI